MLYGPERTQRCARALRRTMSLPEVLLWQELRKRPAGLRFRRQHPAGVYVLDFFCPARKLVIEVDGDAHDYGDRPERDRLRDAWLVSQGVRVIRVRAIDVLHSLEAVLSHIVEEALRDIPLHQPAAGPPPLAGED